MSASVTLRGHFRRLADFAGREDRASFWPYAGVVFLIVTAVGLVIFVPMMHHMMRAMQDFAAQHPDQVAVASGPGRYSVSVGGDHSAFISAGPMKLYLAVTFGLSVLLYAAAVVRRLHDRGKPGAWGLMPLPFILYSSIQMPRMFASFGTAAQPDAGLFLSIFASNMLYMATLIWLIVLLAGAGDPGRTATARPPERICGRACPSDCPGEAARQRRSRPHDLFAGRSRGPE